MAFTETKMHPHAERGNDLYETPDVATHAMLGVEYLPERIWEPACGRGAIATILQDAGHEVIASDLIDYGFEGQQAGVDFTKLHRPPPGIECIVTNPHFKIANQFIGRALHLCPRVIMLLPLRYLAGTKRNNILDSGTLARVHVFRNRLPMMHRDDWEGPKATSMTEFAWFCWDRSHFGPPLINRITWKPLDVE